MYDLTATRSRGKSATVGVISIFGDLDSGFWECSDRNFFVDRATRRVWEFSDRITLGATLGFRNSRKQTTIDGAWLVRYHYNTPSTESKVSYLCDVSCPRYKQNSKIKQNAIVGTRTLARSWVFCYWLRESQVCTTIHCLEYLKTKHAGTALRIQQRKIHRYFWRLFPDT